MRTGRSLQDIARQLEDDLKSRRDYLAPQGAIEATVTDKGAVVVNGFPDQPALGITPFAHGQIATDLGIPKRYYDRMLAEQPALLAQNVNTWLQAQRDNERMFRTLNGNVRAVLSPKYRPLDNHDLASAVLPELERIGAKIMSADLTETRFYVKAVLPSLSDPEIVDRRLAGEAHHIFKDSRLVAGLTLTNSEVGAGTLRVEPSVFTTRCTNFAIIAAASMKKYHIGRAFTADDAYEVFRDETRKQSDRAFWMQVKDVTRAAFKEDAFRAAIQSIRDAQGRLIEGKLPAVVDRAVKILALPEASADSVLTHLAKGGDLSAWGLSSAITATANDWDDYEGATDLERAGGQVLALSDGDWSGIAAADRVAA